MSPAYLRGPEIDRIPSRAPLAQCIGKARFVNAVQAFMVLARTHHAAMTHYHCRFCGHWHLGTNAEPPNIQAKRKANLVRA